MTANIPDKYLDLLKRPVVVTLGTIMPGGEPQLTPVWCSFDGQHLWVNTTRGRQKWRNMRERPQVTVLAVDPDNPYRWLEVRGEVVEMTEQGGVEHINALAKKYEGLDEYYGAYAPTERRYQETRVICKVQPRRVNAVG